MELTYLDNRCSLNEIAVPQIGDRVTWTPSLLRSEVRAGKVTSIAHEEGLGLTFEATMDDGRQVWSWVVHILTINGQSTHELTPRERWAENRRRNAAGLPSIDAKGMDITPKPRAEITMTDAQAAQMTAETAATYDPSSPSYREYQGD